MITHKVCSKCDTIKPVSDYCKDTSRKDGLQSQCKSCKAVWAKQNYATDKGKAAHKIAHRKWYRATKGKTNRERQADLLDAAQEILSDFDIYGEMLQVDNNGEYGTESAIGRLSAAIHQINP
ncbi:hypothetical protein KAR91_74255 [Candidatus Pacearchaeota archaeon]|nr:hypothetical protein [Candidatus Pacearchaeota archaeon]